MARPKSEQKREAILAAAIRVFSERGLSASTSSISQAAGIAEGTLFMYFRTKDELINVLYRELKADLAMSMTSGFPMGASVQDRLRYVWEHYIRWGVENPTDHNVLKQIEVWSGLSEESKKATAEEFPQIEATAQDAVKQKIVRELPLPMIGATVEAMAEMTIKMAQEDPTKTGEYVASGFEILWAGLTRKT